MDERTISITPFQQRVLAIPEPFDLFLGGGRGGAKSYALAHLALRHVVDCGGSARVLYVRRTYQSLADFELVCRDVFGSAFGTEAKYNGQKHTWRLPGGAVVELGQLEGPSDYSKYQGRSFSLLLIDEAGEWADPTDIEMLRSNLRGPRGMLTRTVMAANPGGVGHHWLAQRFVFAAPAPWKPFEDARSGRTWVYAPSTYRDNDHIDKAAYRAQLEAACANDAELLRAWTEGDWAVARGAYFAGVISDDRCSVDPELWEPEAVKRLARTRTDGYTDEEIAMLDPPSGWQPAPRCFELYLAHDWGSSAPSVTLVFARSNGAEGPDGHFYPKGSVVLLDELATHSSAGLNVGLGHTVPELSRHIREMCVRWGMRPRGCADDAIFAKARGVAAASIADEFAAAGVRFTPARKAGRVDGWSRMKALLADAGKSDVPGLYVSRRCRYWWETVPTLARDRRRPEDLDTSGPDHAADACRYGLLWKPPVGFVEQKISNYF